MLLSHRQTLIGMAQCKYLCNKLGGGKVIRIGSIPKGRVEDSDQVNESKVLRLGNRSGSRPLNSRFIGGKSRKGDTSDKEGDEDAQAESRPRKKSKAASECVQTPRVSSASDSHVQTPGSASDSYSFSREIEELKFLSPVETIAAKLKNADDSSSRGPQFFLGLSGPTPYFPQPDEWSCGYRNLQVCAFCGALAYGHKERDWNIQNKRTTIYCNYPPRWLKHCALTLSLCRCS